MNEHAPLKSPGGFALATGDVHLWRLSLRDVSDAERELLSPDERERASRFHFERDRLRFIACRTRLRILLGNYAGVSPSRVSIAYGPQGKPCLMDSDIRFNVSHSQDAGLIAIAREVEVGVDIESLASDIDPQALASRFLGPGERASVLNAPAREQLQIFLSRWTRKEAWLKATGEGLSRPPESFDTSQASAGRIIDLPVGAGFVAALATGGAAHPPILHDWAALKNTRDSTAPAPR